MIFTFKLLLFKQSGLSAGYIVNIYFSNILQRCSNILSVFVSLFCSDIFSAVVSNICNVTLILMAFLLLTEIVLSPWIAQMCHLALAHSQKKSICLGRYFALFHIQNRSATLFVNIIILYQQLCNKCEIVYLVIHH